MTEAKPEAGKSEARGLTRSQKSEARGQKSEADKQVSRCQVQSSKVPRF